MMPKIRSSLLLAAAVASAGLALRAQGSVSPRATPPPNPPRLVVLVVIDQFRADYVDLYGSAWTGGLHRLVTTGALFTEAAYPYSGTVTCPGHNTIGTGVFPAGHGMIGNTWYSRDLKKTVTCTEDASVTSVAFGGRAGKEHHSPHSLTAQSFADQLRTQARRPPRIVSISLKPRAAIGMAGHAGPNTMVIWEEDDGTIATSSAYASAPWPEVDEYVKMHPIENDYGHAWTKLLPPSRYRFEDDAPGEPEGADRAFPHAIVGRGAGPDATFVTAWERSPWSDAYLGDMAIALASKLRLGETPGTDMLAVSFSSLDLVGHPYGPKSHEVQDVLARVDAILGRLLDSLDRRVGRGRYVLALTSDHGVAPLPEQAAGLDAGRTTTAALRDRIQKALAPFAGDAPATAAIVESNIYLTPSALSTVRSNRAAMKALTDAIGDVPGIAHVYWADDIADPAATADPTRRAMRLSYVAGRSGDLVLSLKPYWMFAARGTSHGTPNEYDRHIPLILAGAGIKAGQYHTPASPADIAPTFGALTGVTLARSDGRVLSEALRR